MSRTVAFAILLGVLSTSAIAAAPQRQLVAPNLNPALRTVPSVPHTYSAGQSDASCERRLAARIDSGTVVNGPNGKVAHITGMADNGVGAAELAITSLSADGLSAAADFLVCGSSSFVSPAPVTATMQIKEPAPASIAIRTQSNSIVLKTR
jgi:hypothetical protein